jgi:hypothetical protein
MRGEHHKTRRDDDDQSPRRPWQRMPGEHACRHAARNTEQAQVENEHRADEHDEAEDVKDLNDRIEPELAAHRNGKRALFDGREQPCGAGRRHQRSSTVLPFTVMRSARISSGLFRFG